MRLLASPTLQHDQALAALATAFSRTPIEPPQQRLDDSSRWLFGTAELSVHDQAHALADLLTNRLGLIPDSADHRALLIDHALDRRRAHPLLIAAIGHELARRAGLSSHVALCAGHPWTVVRGEDSMALVGSASLPSRPRAGAIRPRCPHEVAQTVLAHIRDHGPPAWKLEASGLLRALPVRGCPGRIVDNDANARRGVDGG